MWPVAGDDVDDEDAGVIESAKLAHVRDAASLACSEESVGYLSAQGWSRPGEESCCSLAGTKAKDAYVRIERIRAVIHHVFGKPDRRRLAAPLWEPRNALLVLDGHLVGQADRTINYAERHRVSLRCRDGHRREISQFPGERSYGQVAADAPTLMKRQSCVASPLVDMGPESVGLRLRSRVLCRSTAPLCSPALVNKPGEAEEIQGDK